MYRELYQESGGAVAFAVLALGIALVLFGGTIARLIARTPHYAIMRLSYIVIGSVALVLMAAYFYYRGMNASATLLAVLAVYSGFVRLRERGRKTDESDREENCRRSVKGTGVALIIGMLLMWLIIGLERMLL